MSIFALLYEVKKENPVNLNKLLSYLSIEVKEVDLDHNIAFKVRIKKNNSCLLLINKHHSISRKRFSIAHYLGFYILRRITSLNEFSVDKQYNLIDSDNLSYIQKKKIIDFKLGANSFAGDLLYPKSAIIEYYKIQKLNISEIADKLLTTNKAIEFRLEKLKKYNFI